MQPDTTESGETPVDAATTQEREVKDDLLFLAREFLTWLAFYAETEGGKFTGSTLVDFTIAFAGRMTLRTPAGLVTDMALKGPSPGGSADLRYALAGGLAVKEADLVLEQGDRLWSFGLAAENLDVKRCRLPTLLDDDCDDPAAERVELLRVLDENLKHAFSTFLALRASAAWSRGTVPAIRAWVDEGT